ncbi:cytochrome c oxidase subunit I [Acidimangrovimonas pyrenivorans]|uniref:Cbb3-type cytochrome c oxidase subunit I n=1 Tax=Acidimangrovimonas pyrenivorans TaxID=2030798 RepID=A0ABV7AGP4_9RHOB
MSDHSGMMDTGTARHGWLHHAAPMLRAVLWAAIGCLGADWIVALLLNDRLAGEWPVVAAFFAGSAGWILGGGALEACVRPWFGDAPAWDEGEGIGRFLRFHTDHKIIGMQYQVTAILTFLAAGMAAMMMRLELLTPNLDVFQTSQAYNEAFGVHGSLMLFAVSVVAIVGGFGNYFVPVMVGADDMTYPRLNGLSWWFLVPGVMAILLSPLAGGFQTGWTGYSPLAAEDAVGQDLYYLGIFALGLSSLFTAINVISTTLYMRAPGLTIGRLPMFVWGMFVTSVLNLLWVPVIGTGMIFGLADRTLGTHFFDSQGLPVLWQDLFWLFGHPEVYIIMLPAWGLWLEIIPVFSRKRLFGYGWAVAGMIGVTVLSSYVWTHHMFTTVSDSRLVPFMTTTELISIPTGFMYIAALGTLWKGRLRLRTPMLLALMSVFNFLIGGFTGVFLSDVPADFQLHNTYFVVAHFHYTIIGGMVFAWLAGLYYWFPKYSGRMYNEGWGKLSAWLVFFGFNFSFLGMFVAGFDGMNRRVAEYMPYLGGINEWISIWAFLLGLAFGIALLNLLVSAISGERAGDNPWGGKTLEWQTSSPPPHGNFAREPVVTDHFYNYGAGDRT